MVIIDNDSLLDPAWRKLIQATANKGYWFGGFNSLEEFHQKEKVNVIVERKANQLPVLHQETIIKLNEILDSRIPLEQKEEIRNLINTIRNIVVLGEYKPSENNIYLYIETIKSFKSNHNDYLLTTYIHEMLHAYFDRTGHKGLPYIFEIEESLAEAGMLVFLDQVNDNRLSWALQNVKNKWPELKDYARGAELYLNWKKRQNDLITTITNYKSTILATSIPAKNIPSIRFPATMIRVNASRRYRDAFEDYLLKKGFSPSSAVEKACVLPSSRIIREAVEIVSNKMTDNLFDIFSESELNHIEHCVLGRCKRYTFSKCKKTFELYREHLQKSGWLRP